jgi:hypothetical protein
VCVCVFCRESKKFPVKTLWDTPPPPPPSPPPPPPPSPLPLPYHHRHVVVITTVLHVMSIK